MAIDFVAIDFETANFARASACAVGVARFSAGRVVEELEWFIDPPGGRLFTNTAVHGIEERHVMGAPSWSETLLMLDRFVAGADLIAYSGFDRSVYNAANKLHALDRSDFAWRDALAMVRHRYPLDAHPIEDHRLPTIVQLLGLGAFDHHRAGADAVMCARVVGHVALVHDIDSLDVLWPPPSARGPRGKRYVYRPQAPLPQRNDAADSAHPLFGEVLCFSGDLDGFTRAEAQRIAADFGATVGATVTKKTTLVVMGQFDPASLRAGATLSSKIERALELAAKGQHIEVIDESAFVELINLDPDSYA